MKKKISLGLLLLTATLLITGASTVDAFPAQTIGCDNCHAYPPTLINITTDKAAITVSPGQAFTVNLTWSGGANDGAMQTAVKWPTVLDNALFGLNPVVPVAVGINPGGTATSTLTAPATPGTYTVRVYAATGTWASIPTKETDYKNIAVKVQAPPTPVLTTITVSPATASLVVGGTQTFTASKLDQFSNPIAATITWSSSNTTVGTIDTTGKFTALAAGTTTIKAENGTVNGTATATVTASPPVLTTITVSPATASLVVGGTQTFTATALDQLGNIFSAIMTWASGNTTVGTIDATGKFTALAAGTTNITASNGTVNGSAIVSVTAPPIYSQAANVTFVVTDNVTGLPVEEAVVSMDGFKIETDDTGTAIFTGVAPGNHAYAASGEDYIKTTGSVSVSGDTTVAVKLVPGEEQEHKGHENKEDD